MSFMPTGAPGIGNAMVRVGADFRGMSTATTKAMTQFRGQMAAGTAGLGTASKNATALGNNMETATKKASKLGLALRGAAIGFGAIALGGAVMAIKAAMDFESAFAGVKKTVSASEETLEMLRQQFLQLARDIPVSASSLARIGEAAGALGVPTDQILNFVKVVSTIGTTTDVSVDQAGTALGQLSNILDMTGEDYNRFASTLVDLGNKGASTESQIIEITRRFGSAAKLFGIATPQILALGSAAANLGMQPQLAASSLQRLVMRLLTISSGFQTVGEVTKKAGIDVATFKKIVEEGGDKLDKLADVVPYSGKELIKIAAGLESLDALQMALGVTQQQFEKMRRTHPEQIIEEMFRAMKGMDAGERQMFITRLLGPAASAGGGVGLQQLMFGLADSVDRNLTPSLRNAAVAWEVNNAAMKEAEKRYATTSSQLQMLQNTFTDVMITAGTGSLPMVADVMGKIREAIPNIVSALGDAWDIVQGPLQQVGDALFRVFGVAQDILFDWSDGGSADGMLGTLNVLSGTLETIAGWLTGILDLTTQLLSNPIINTLAKMAVLWGGIAIAFKAMMGMRNFVVGAATSLGGMMGAPIRAIGTAISPSDKLQMDAALMQSKAAATQMAAATREAATPPMMPMPMPTSGLSRTPIPVGPFALAGDAMGMSAAAATAAMNARLAAQQAGAMSSMRGRIMAAATGAQQFLGNGLKNLGSSLSRGFGLISRAFWPLFIADLIGNLASPMIGDFIGKATGMKRLAASFQKGWMDGVQGLFQTWFEGSDAFVGRQSQYKLATDEAGNPITVNRSTIQALAAGSGGSGPMDQLGDLVTGAKPNADLTAINEILDAFDQAQTGDDQIIASARLAEWLVERKGRLDKMKTDVAAMQKAAAEGEGLQGEYTKAVVDFVAQFFENIGDLEEQYAASREELQDMVIKVFRESGIDAPLGRVANLEVGALSDLINMLKALPSDAPAGFASALARLSTGITQFADVGGDPLVALAETVKSVTEEMTGLTQAVATLDPSLKKGLDLFRGLGPSGDLMADIQGASSRADKVKIIKALDAIFPKDQDILASQKKRVDDVWSQLLEYYAITMGQLGLTPMQGLANTAAEALSGAISSQLVSGQVNTSIEELVAGLGNSMEDGVGESDFADRTSGAVLSALVKAFKELGKDQKARERIKAATQALLADAGVEMTEGMNLRSVILASLAPSLEGKSKEDQQKILDRARRNFGEDMVPKSVQGLRRALKAPDVQKWQEYFAGLKNAVKDPKTGLAATVTTIETETGKIPAVVDATTPLVQVAAEALTAALLAPLNALPGQIDVAAGDIAGALQRLSWFMQAENILNPQAPSPGSREAIGGLFGDTRGSGGGSGGGGSPGGRRRRRGNPFTPRGIGGGSRSSVAAPARGGVGGRVSNQTINVDRMELHGASSERSVLAQINFLSPAAV